MMSTLNPTLSSIYSELVLSLYPILIKLAPTTLLTSTLARFIVFPILALTAGPFKEFLDIWGNAESATYGFLHGLLNLVHVGTSYISFQELPAGTAVSLFYTYPIMILLSRAIFANESLPSYALIVFTLALIGAYLVATSHYEESDTQEHKRKSLRGIIAAITAAITETFIYFFVRERSNRTPFYTLNHLYPGGLIVLLIYSLFNKKQLDTRRSTWLPMIGFNALLGFTGYLLRFYSIPKLPTLLFAALSYIGIIAAYIWGIIFVGEKPTLKGVVGGSMIATAIAILRSKMG